MFADRYFPDRYFAPRYWPTGADDDDPPEHPGFGVTLPRGQRQFTLLRQDNWVLTREGNEQSAP